jgi:hypothetical protein
LTKAQVRLAQAAMANRDTSVGDLAAELGVKPVTLYRYVSPTGQLRKTENGCSAVSLGFRALPQTTP